jgi:nucleoside-diphosphate-sugar epimerase
MAPVGRSPPRRGQVAQRSGLATRTARRARVGKHCALRRMRARIAAVMRILVMGGTEFISLHLAEALRRQRHAVTVFNRGRSLERLPAGVEAITGDRKDHAGLAERLRGRPFDGVCDVTYAPTSGEDVAALLDGLVGQPHVVFVSTARVYDHTLPIPYAEGTPRGLYWGEYARHKISCEDVLLERHRRYGWPVSIVRPTHVYGPLNTRNNEMFFMDRIARGRPVLVPGHGGWLRQFGHVEDLAEAMAAMLGNPRTYGQVYNVMGEETVTQVGLVELVAEVMERPVTLRHVDPALLKRLGAQGPVFGQNLVYDCHAVHTTHQVRRDLDLRWRYTLSSGLAHTWKWYRDQGLVDRPVDFSFEDRVLAELGA